MPTLPNATIAANALNIAFLLMGAQVRHYELIHNGWMCSVHVFKYEPEDVGLRATFVAGCSRFLRGSIE